MTVSARPPAGPSGGMPQGSAHGLAALGILPGLVPFLVLQSLVPVLRNGMDVWLGSLLPVIGISVVAAAIIAFGLAARRRWYIRLIFTLGWVILAGYAAGVGLDILVLLGVVPKNSPDLGFFNVVNIIAWMVVSPLAWLVLRLLRLRYWQPGTTAAEWERPESVPHPRTLLMSWLGRKD